MLLPDTEPGSELGGPPFEFPDTGTFRSGMLPLPPTGGLNGTTDIMTPSVPDTTICDLLMNSPMPPSIAEVPYYCACWRCKGTAGPKGDRGDRGPPGMSNTLNKYSLNGTSVLFEVQWLATRLCIWFKDWLKMWLF